MNWRSEKPSGWVAESFVWKVSIWIYFLRKVSELLWVQCRSIPWSLAWRDLEKIFQVSLMGFSECSPQQGSSSTIFEHIFWRVQISYKTISLDLWSSIIDQITHDRRRTQDGRHSSSYLHTYLLFVSFWDFIALSFEQRSSAYLRYVT